MPADFRVPQEALDACAREPIHAPGRVQPRGVLLSLSGPDLAVTGWSANAPAALGREFPAGGLPLAAALPAAAAEAVRAAAAGLTLGRVAELGQLPGLPGREARVHRQGRATLAELVDGPAGDDGPAAPGGALAAVGEAAALLAGDGPAADLYAAVAAGVRALTGYARVMVYEFDPDWNGAVVGEARGPDLEPFLGLRFPAADVPRQARDLYAVNPLRVLADIHAPAVPVVPAARAAGLDLSHCLLRDFSPVHREYLSNMGVRATLTASVLAGGKLWGLIACHHPAPRWPSAGARRAAGVFADLVAAHAGKEAARRAAASAARAGRVVRAVAHAPAGADWADALVRPEVRLADLVAADGVAVVRADEVFAGGAAPAPGVVRRIADWLAGYPGDVFLTDQLARDHPALADPAGVACGVLAVAVGRAPGTWVLWFRREQARTVVWGGDPAKGVVRAPDGAPRLRPRTSFAAWREQVRGRSLPWTADDLAAAAAVFGGGVPGVIADWPAAEAAAGRP